MTISKQGTETLLIKDKELFKAELEERIELGNVMRKKKLYSSKDVEDLKKGFQIWNNYNSEFLKVSFNINSNEYKKEYDNAGEMLGYGYMNKLKSAMEKEYVITCDRIDAKNNAMEALVHKVNSLKIEPNNAHSEQVQQKIDNKKVFIVHGHNAEMENKTARLLEQLKLEPIILHERASQGDTIIEKIEEHSDVGFAIVLLTGDDLGEAKAKIKDLEDLKRRARQNVIFEQGYFIGKLGRKRVVSLYENNVELPNDLSGVVYVPIDDAGMWKFKVVQELKQGGYDVDANVLIKLSQH
jgi:predicted nucleotide-binding protein